MKSLMQPVPDKAGSEELHITFLDITRPNECIDTSTYLHVYIPMHRINLNRLLYTNTINSVCIYICK